MLNEKKIASIRRMRDKNYPVEVIATRTGCCINTVYKYLKPEHETAEEKELAAVEGKLAPYEPIIRAWLVDDKRRYYKQRHTARRVFDRLTEEFPSFDCGYKTVQRFYTKTIGEIYLDKNSFDNYVPIAGEAEIGCSSIKCTIKGKRVTAYILALCFPYSLATYVQIIPARNPECILSALQRIYEYLGGVPPVQKFMPTTNLYKYHLSDVADIDNELLMRFIMFYGFKDNYYVPNPDQPSKRCSQMIVYCRRQLLKNAITTFDLAPINQNLLHSCDKLNERRCRNTTHTVSEMFVYDNEKFLPMPSIPFKVISYRKQKANKVCEITVDKNHRYYLLPELKNKFVYVYLTETQVLIHDLNDTLVQSFDRLYADKPSDVTDPQVLLCMLRFKPGALLHSKFAEVLPDSLHAFLSGASKKVRRVYVTAMYTILTESDLETALTIASIAAGRGFVTSIDILKTYKEMTDEQQNNT